MMQRGTVLSTTCAYQHMLRSEGAAHDSQLVRTQPRSGNMNRFGMLCCIPQTQLPKAVPSPHIEFPVS